MNLMFWKKKPAGDAAVNESVPGLPTRIKAQVAALTNRFKSPPAFTADVPASAEAGARPAEDVAPESDAPAGAFARMKSGLMAQLGRLTAPPKGEASPARRMRLIVVGVLLLLLLLGAFGYAAWTIVRSAPDPQTDVTELIEEGRAILPLPIVMPESSPATVLAPAGEGAASAIPAAESQGDQPASAVAESEPVVGPPVSSVAKTESVAEHPVPHKPMTEVEMLRQKNAELQAELDALKKSQRSSTAVKMYPGDRGTPAGGVATVGSSDPKAAASTLKEAIEAMNKGRNYQEKPAK